jgi:hypothetical protein
VRTWGAAMRRPYAETRVPFAKGARGEEDGLWFGRRWAGLKTGYYTS